MVDENLEVLAGTRSLGRVEDQAFEAGRLEIIVERGVVLEIDFGPPPGDLVERRLGDEEVPVGDQFRHLPVEEGQQQRADVGAVDVGVRHDHDLVITQLVDVELFGTDRRADRLDEGADLLGAEHAVETGPLDVEDLALERQDRLVLAVAALLGGAAGAVALDQEQFAQGRVAFLAVGKLARQRGDPHH